MFQMDQLQDGRDRQSVRLCTAEPLTGSPWIFIMSKK